MLDCYYSADLLTVNKYRAPIFCSKIKSNFPLLYKIFKYLGYSRSEVLLYVFNFDFRDKCFLNDSNKNKRTPWAKQIPF